MSLHDDVRILSGVRLFQGFSPEQLRLLAFGSEKLRVARHHEICREGAAADAAYVVAAGQAGLYRERGGERAWVGTAGPGMLLGEVALIAPTHWLTSAAAMSDVTLMRLDRMHFRRILEEYPELAVLLHKRISSELQTMIRRIEELSPRFAG